MAWHKEDFLDEEQRKFLEEDFKLVFRTVPGKRVLTKIMSDLCFFHKCDTDEEVVLNNYAKKLWSYLGDWDPGSEDSIVNKLLREKDNGIT